MIKKSFIVLTLTLPCVCWAEPQPDPASSKTPDLAECTMKKDPIERLNCYDEFALPDTDKLKMLGDSTRQWIESSNSAVKQRVKQELTSAYEKFVITPHRPNYIMPISYNHNVNSDVYESAGVLDTSSSDLDDTETKFQLSLKIPIDSHFLFESTSLWFTYTQVAYWQVYNSDASSPFRETNYEPELLIFYRTDAPFLGTRLFGVTLSINHQSNGRSDPLSRSWNRIMLGLLMETKNMVLGFKPWYRIPEDKDEDNNPDIDDYLGYFDLDVAYKLDEQNFNILFRNNLETDNNRSSVEMNWSFPIDKRINGIIQYVNGYGDGLIDYNHRSQRLGIGILITGWL